ncbi:MAG: MFS transporter [Henriciella sp.]
MAQGFSAFRHSAYRRYFTARFLAAFAVNILSVAVAWQIYDQTQNPALLGWIGLVQFAPALLLVLVTGVAADRFGRRNIMGLSAMVEAACAGTILTLAVTGQFDPIYVLGVLTVFGIARAFLSPASAALAVNIVPREDFANAVGWSASSWQLAAIVGPAAGGLLYGVSAQTAYSVSTAALVLSSLLIFAIPKPEQARGGTGSSLSMVLGGFRYVWKQKVVLGAISLDLFAVLLGGAVALLPVYARDILELGPMGLGLLRAAPGVGAIAVVTVLAVTPIRDHAGKILFASVALFGAATVVFGQSTTVWLSILALLCIGGFDMISVYIREILLQLWTPDDVRGRVNAVNSIFIGASNELGEARAGFMAAKWGTVFTVVAGGYAAIGIAGAWAVLFPTMRRTRHLQGQETGDGLKA